MKIKPVKRTIDTKSNRFGNPAILGQPLRSVVLRNTLSGILPFLLEAHYTETIWLNKVNFYGTYLLPLTNRRLSIIEHYPLTNLII